MKPKRLRGPYAKRMEIEESFDALEALSENMPGREVVVTEHVDEPRNWQILGAFHDSPYVPYPPHLSHAVVRLRDLPRNRITHLYEWWAPAWLASPKELSGAFYAHELEPLLKERGIWKGFATLKEVFALR